MTSQTCSVTDCATTALRSLNRSRMEGCSLSITGEKTIRLCKDHYKVWKKETKSIRETERARYG